MEDINKDIEILENLLEEGFEAMCYPEAQAIEHLIQAYKELEEENQQLEAIKDEAIRRYNLESIPVSLVEETIGELKPIINKYEKQIENDEETDLSYEEIRNYASKLEAFEELLEKRK